MKTQSDPKVLFKHWIKERHAIYLRKNGLVYTADPNWPRLNAKPWTDDPILGAYRFCNVYRQLDKVTVWLNDCYYPWFKDTEKPFAACVARLINEPEPLLALLSQGALPNSSKREFNPKLFAQILEERKTRGLSIRSAAYIVSTNGRPTPFPEYIANEVLAPLWAGRAKLDPRDYSSLLSYSITLKKFMGIASFIAGQIVADLKYVHPHFVPGPGNPISDWRCFVVPGPGSKRGLNRLHGFQYDRPMPDKDFHRMFSLAQKLADDVAFDNDYPLIHAQDVQNCLCEFDKYMRAYTGQGKPKQRY